jgi:hypothetical protein
MSETSKNLTHKQRALVEWLALPKNQRHPHTQELFAEELNISEKTLRRWKKELGLDREAAELAREQVKDHLPDIYGALVREAKRGSYHHTEEVNVNVSDKRERVRRELSEFERRRRAQVAG